MAEIEGFVAPGFERVADAFARNFAERGELGAAFAATREGEPVVDLWGGVADRTSGKEWDEETLALVFSGTKGVVAVCVLMAIERGLLDLETPVAAYWPEFGKRHVLVRHVVSHTARLPGIDRQIGLDRFCDGVGMARLLEEQAPSGDPRAGLCYHAFTFGWLCAELIRRVDGRSIGRVLAEDVAEPLGLEIWIGLPAEHEGRVARIELAEGWPRSVLLSRQTRADPLARAIWSNPPTLSRDAFAWNDPALHAAGIPAVGAIATARSIARLYGGLGRLLSPETLALARAPLVDGWDAVHATRRRYGVGFALQADAMQLGPPDDAFGHDGAGGSVHGAWPSHGVSFSYAMNLLRDDAPVDPRARTLLEALSQSVGSQ
jgi:CubicO group peptidase (beta-lactamase class C family)